MLRNFTFFLTFLTAIFTTYISPAHAAQVTNLTALDVQTGGRVLLTWDEFPEDLSGEYFHLYRKVSSETNYEDLVRVVTGNYFEDKALQNQVSYDYKLELVAPDPNNPNSKIFTDKGLITITPTKTKSLALEGLVFVIEKPYADKHPEVTNYLTSVVSELNTIYSINTNKRFFLQSIEYYNPATACPQDSCEKMFADKNYYFVPGTITVFIGDHFISSERDGSETHYPSFQIALEVCSGYSITCNWSANSSIKGRATLLAHEAGHSFGVGWPEYYHYFGITPKSFDTIITDQSGILPTISTPIIPAGYENDPMIIGTTSPKFGPLSSTMISRNTDHSKFLQNIFSIMPDNSEIKFINVQNQALAGVQIKIFCLADNDGNQLTEISPRHVLISDTNGQIIFQKITWDSQGYPTLLYNDILNYDTCIGGGWKAYLDGYEPIARPFTMLEWQEQKIINNSDNYVATAILHEIPGNLMILGDLNNDKIVNSLDWSIMSGKWLTNDPVADLNNDDSVNSLDWSIMSTNWLRTG